MVTLTKSPAIGSSFTTGKSKVTGIVQEVVKNANGSLRVRLDVAGATRWTTVKQSSITLCYNGHMRTCKSCGTEFLPTSRKRYMCKPCEAASFREYRHANKDKVREINKQRYIRNRQIVYNHYKDNPCVICGESRIACLQLDHLDPTEKSFGLANLYNRSESAILEEIAKCRVLCANCHMVFTAEQQGWYKDIRPGY